MALSRKEFTKVQHRSHTRRVCECQPFLRSVLCDGISCIDQISSFTLSSTSSKILLSQFSRDKRKRNRLILSRKVSFHRMCGLVNNIKTITIKTNIRQQDGGREPVASKKMTLGQVVPNFTGQVVSSKILRIFR